MFNILFDKIDENYASFRVYVNDEKFANHNPQTMVFKLVEELLGKSKKLNKELVDKFG